MRKIAHIGVVDKFLTEFLMFNRNYLSEHGHFYYLIGKEEVILHQYNVVSPLKNFLRMIQQRKTLQEVDVICLHGLFDKYTFIYFILFPSLLHKCNWFIWGGDVHVGLRKLERYKYRLKEFLRVYVLKRIPNYVTYINSDYELARRLYNPSACMRECILYPSNIYTNSQLPTSIHHRKVVVMLGNSADITNRHFQIIDEIASLVDSNMQIHIPLTYGDTAYAKDVIEYAKQKLNCEIVALTTHKEYNDYLSYLDNVDIAIMYHEKQMGMGATIQLLGRGKTIYFATDSEAYAVFKKLGLLVYTLEGKNLSVQEASEHNKNLIQRYFSKEMLIQQLEMIYAD